MNLITELKGSLCPHLAHGEEIGVEDSDVHLPEAVRAQLAPAPEVLHPHRLPAHSASLIAANLKKKFNQFD